MYANTGRLHFWQYHVPEGRKSEILFLREFFDFHTELWNLFPFSHSQEEWLY